ncbi:MAG: response regulator transcription factor [Actinomycetota bacterium]|nr:response regulator transcription factor [Actinomycetota bacterium]
MEPPKHILIAEDDTAVRESLERALRLEGYAVTTSENGQKALDLAAVNQPDLYLLDVMMPVLDGLSVCRQIRRQGDKTPVLVLTAKHEISDRVSGLDAGADDYLLKPFALDELLARIRALLRRVEVGTGSSNYVIGNLTLDLQTRRVTRAGRELELTKTEFDLLELLMRNENIVLTREMIYDEIWDYNFETKSKSLDVYVGYLRRKVDNEPSQKLIHTVRGVGYCMRQK